MLNKCKVGGNGIIVAADVPDTDALRNLLLAIKDVPGITGIKIGFLLAMEGLDFVVQLIRTELGESVDIIYDHQKAGNDIPDMGVPFAKKLKLFGVDAAILFPFAGPATQEAWTTACLDAGLDVLTGGIMTHPTFLAREGGYIDDTSVFKIYQRALTLGCRHFVVPGTKIEWVIKIREHLEDSLGVNSFSLHAPGLITQGGDISECGKAAGMSFYPIVGRAIYEPIGMEAQRTAAMIIAEKFLSQIEEQRGV